MRQKWNMLAAVLLTLCLLLSMPLTVCAHAVPDLTRQGSVTVTVRKDGAAVSGGTLTIYRVGEVVAEDGNYTFVPTGEFLGCGESFATLDASAELAARLLDFAQTAEAVGSTLSVSEDGSVTFAELPLGLYLIAQHTAAPGYAALAPFLVSVPYLQDGEYVYDLSAVPKTALEREPEPTVPTPTQPSDPDLPLTGQLWWPVPVLAAAGMVLFALGWALFVSKEKRYEG